MSVTIPQNGPAALPALALQSKTMPVVDPARLSPEESTAADDIAAKIDFADGTAIGLYASSGMQEFQRALDRVLQEVRVGDLGEAGDVVISITHAMDEMKLKELRAEVEDGSWRNRLSHLPLVGGLFSAVIYFHERRTKFLTIVDEIDRKARAQIRAILEFLVKGDSLISGVERQYYALAVLIVAGERALARGQAEYERQCQQAKASGDAMLYAKAASLYENLMAFDTRLMRLKTAYAKAPVTDQQIKLGQAAGRATVNRIQDTLDFTLADLKTAIIQVAGLYEMRQGLEDAAAVDKLEAQVEGLGQSMLEQTYKGAKATQADATVRVQRLAELMDRVAQLTREGQELNKQNQAARRDAERVLTQAMQTYKEALLATDQAHPGAP